MDGSRRRRPSPPLIISIIALIVALSGTGYAALKLPKSSVTSGTIKNGQVKNRDLAKNAVTSSKVMNGSLLGADFKPGQLVSGRPGPKGDPGQKGDQGIQGLKGDPGTARAYALVQAGGGTVPAQSHNVTSVGHTGPGQYCVELDPSVPATATGAVVSPAYAYDSTSIAVPAIFAHAEYTGALCGTNGRGVVTFKVIPASGSMTSSDEGFFIVVP